MTHHEIKCTINVGDTLTARKDDDEIGFVARCHGAFVQSVYTDAADARTFARGILALADEVDGGEVAEAVPAVKVGDRIRIITAGSRGARVRAGEIYTVRDVTDYDIRVDGAGANGLWYLNPDDVEKIDDEPIIDTSKVVAPDNSALPRAALLEQAMDLMSGSQTYTATDLTELADYLAGESA